RAHRASAVGKSRQHPVAPALPDPGSVIAEWPGRALRERQRHKRNDRGGSCRRCLRTRRAALLKAIGGPLPAETAIGIDLRYATCVFAIPEDASTDWKTVRTLGQLPQIRRGGLMLPLEGNRWMVTIGGRHGDVPPGDAEGFLTYASRCGRRRFT